MQNATSKTISDHCRGSLNIWTKNKPFLDTGHGCIAGVVLGQQLIDELINMGKCEL